MKEVARLLAVRQLCTSRYHPMENGKVETFDETLKLMLKCVCAEPRNLECYLAEIGRHIHYLAATSVNTCSFSRKYGAMKVWKSLNEETKTTYQHVLELRNELEETCHLAHELEKAGTRYANIYNRKASNRQFPAVNKVLVLLPTDNNQLLLHWKEIFEVKERKGEADYVIETQTGPKTFHANL